MKVKTSTFKEILETTPIFDFEKLGKPIKPEIDPRKLMLLRIDQYDLLEDPDFASALESWDKRYHRPPKELLHLLTTKYNLPPDSEIVEIVDTKNLNASYRFIAKMRHKDFEPVREGEYIPVFNPKPPEESTIQPRRKPLIFI